MKEIAEFALPSQQEVHLDLRALFAGAVQVVLEQLLDEEVREMVGAERFERAVGRKDVRNGSYVRRLLTSLGQIEVAVPRARDQGAPTHVLGAYRRRTADLDAAISSAYVHGVSTRKLGHVTESLLGGRVARSTVSRVTASLEEQVEALRKAPIRGSFPYLFLDATFVDMRWARAVENLAVLVAYGVGSDGHRDLLAVTIGASESEQSWTDLLRQLLDRGLDGVQLVIADDHKGLAAAVRHLLPEAKRQRCVVHLMRNVLSKTPARLRSRVARAVSRIFASDGLAEAKKGLAQFEDTLGAAVPEALQCLRDGFADACVFFAFPQAHWSRIKSTNGLERLHGEVKRRTRVVGAFPDRASALRLIVAVALGTTAVWRERRYLDMTLLAAKSAVREEKAA